MDTTKRFEEVYALYNKDVFRLAYSYVLNKEDAEDILQRVFVKLYKNKKILSLNSVDIKKWLFKVCSNEAKDLLKSPWRKLIKNVDNEKEIIKPKSDLLEILPSIAAEYRIPLYLYYYEGYSIKEIASILKKSESAIKMRLSRGKEKLKKEMEGEK